MSCVFCSGIDVAAESKLSFAIYDKFPVNEGHMLIIPKRHVSSYFDLNNLEKQDLYELMEKMKKYLDKTLSPDGYNIGINVGEAAGQTVMHVHMHLIPRYKGDIENPRGGVRGVIPGKMNY